MDLSPWDSPSRGHNQSQWLHTTLSDLDMKMKNIIKLTTAENAECRADGYGKGKPELIQMLEELDRSYRCLAEEHDQLRSKSINFPGPGVSSSCKFRRVKSSGDNLRVDNFYYDPELEVVDSHPESIVEDPDSEFDSTNLDHEYLNKIADELKSSELCNDNSNKNLTVEGNHMTRFIHSPKREDSKTNIGDPKMDSFEREHTWFELKFQVTKLVEENIRQQAELLRRNAEKRETIKELRSQLEYMKAENRALQSCLGFPRVDVQRNQNQKSRLKRQFSLKFLGCS